MEKNDMKNTKKNETKNRKPAVIMFAAMLLFAALLATPGRALQGDMGGYQGMMFESYGLGAMTYGTEQYFLKLDGVEGESMDDRHRGELEILSYSWGVSNAGAMTAGSGGGAGKASFQDFHFMKTIDKSSPVLMLHAATGEHIKEAKLTVRKSGEGPLEYMTITLTDVMVSLYSNGGSSGSPPMDSFSLNFAKIEFSYRPTSADGMLDKPIKATYDLKKGTKI